MKLKKIAAICAYPRKKNPGMIAVDTSIYYLIKKLKHNVTLDFFSFGDFQNFNVDKINYQPIVDFMPEDYDCIIIWGDFQLSYMWHINDIKDSLKELFYEKVFLTNSNDDVLKKVIIYGQCIFLDNEKQYNDDFYFKSLKRLLLNASYIRFRDPLSAARAKFLIDMRLNSKIDFGIDAALLLPVLSSSDSEEETSKVVTDNNIGFFYGRTQKGLFLKVLLAIVFRKKRKKYNLKFKWLPWFQDFKTPPKYIHKLLNFEPMNLESNNLNELISKMRSCKLVVTDTYHLSLIAWSNGIPAIMIGKGAQTFKSTVDDKKKEIFYIQFQIQSMYFYNENWYQYFVNKELCNQIDLLLNGYSFDKTFTNLKNVAVCQVDDLIKEITLCLDSNHFE
jgi:hypothetical protein